MTTAQKKALEVIDNDIVLENELKNGHAYNGNTKLVDRRTLVVLEDEKLIEWKYDWGYDCYKLILTDLGQQKLLEIKEMN